MEPAEQSVKQTFTYYSQLRSELSTWLDQSARVDGPGRNRGGEDEANYALTWLPQGSVTECVGIRAAAGLVSAREKYLPR